MSVAQGIKNYYIDTTNILATAANTIASMFGFNLNKHLMREKLEKSKQFQSLISTLIQDYENKLANTTPTTRPSLNSFITSYLSKNKDKLLSIQRSLDSATNALQEKSDSLMLDYRTENSVKSKADEAINQANQALKDHESNMKKIFTVAEGQQNKFSNATKVNQAIKGGQTSAEISQKFQQKAIK